MQKAFQHRLYPSKEQECLLLDTLETLRHLYNNFLAERIDAYKHEGKSISYVERANQLPILKKSAAPLAQIYSQVVQDCLKRLDKAYQHFFRRVKTGKEKAGFPRSISWAGIVPSPTQLMDRLLAFKEKSCISPRSALLRFANIGHCRESPRPARSRIKPESGSLSEEHQPEL